MKRRSFIKRGASCAVASFGLPTFPFSGEKAKWDCSYRSTELETTISVPGLPESFSVLQVSDSHISCDNESDQEYEIYSKRMGSAFPMVTHYKTRERVLPLEGFAAMMELAKESEVSLIVLSGDIINYPSATAVAAVAQLVKGTGIPYVYTAGNHDWHYEGMAGTADSLRAEWVEKRLKPLYAGNPFFHQV